MNGHNHNHEDLFLSLTEEYSDLLANSEQGIYIYLDDEHKVCNKKFATLLDYGSEDEWAKVGESFPVAFVADQSQETLVSAFQDAIEKGKGSTNKIIWKKKDGSTVSTQVILVPIAYEGHLLALHFVTKK